jgi:hypothetical protein
MSKEETKEIILDKISLVIFSFIVLTLGYLFIRFTPLPEPNTRKTILIKEWCVDVRLGGDACYETKEMAREMAGAGRIYENERTEFV